jgi:type I restriction enzyme M protein
LSLQNPINVKLIVEEINAIDFLESDFDAKGSIFEYFLNYQGKNDDLAQYFTPRLVVRFMVNYLSPKLGEKVYDPFCGSGGMLIEAYQFLHKQILPKDLKKASELHRLRKETLYGNDIANIAYVAKLNMILVGDGHNNITRGDTLKNKIENKYEIVITNIPFNLKTKFGNLYPHPTDDANSICVQHIVTSLKNTAKARAGIIVPDKFVSAITYQKLRQSL